MPDADDRQIVRLAREAVQREAEAVAALAGQMDGGIARCARALLACPGHILVTGAGTSRAVAMRLAHLLACVGRPALFVNAADALHGGSGAVTARDILYIISKGGRSDEINQFAQIAKAKGATVVAQTEAPGSPLAQLSDLVLRVAAPADADPFGMVATGSSLVNAAAGDALCAVLLEMGGYTKEQFGRTHPEGAVGRKLEQERLARTQRAGAEGGKWREEGDLM